MKKLLLILFCLPLIGYASFPVLNNQDYNIYQETPDNINLKDDITLKASNSFDIFGIIALAFSIAALVLGLVLWSQALPIIFASLSIILGVIGLLQKNRLKGMSISSLAVGVLYFVLLMVGVVW